MSRIQTQTRQGVTQSRLRLPADFLPSARQIFPEQAQSVGRFASDATAGLLRSAAGLALSLRAGSEDAAKADYETTSAKAVRLQGELSRTRVEDPRFDELASEIELLEQRSLEKFEKTDYEADAARLFESTKTQVFTARSRAIQEAESNAQLAARGQFRRQITQHVRELRLNEDAMRDYLTVPPEQLDDIVEADFLSALPDELRPAVESNPQLLEEFFTQRDAFVSSVDRQRIALETQANDLLADQAQQERQFAFASDPTVGLNAFLSGIPDEQQDNALKDLSGYLSAQMSLPVDSPDALETQRVTATKAEQLIEYYGATGQPDLAEGLSAGLKRYYSNTSKYIAGTFQPDYEGMVNDQFIAGYEQYALRQIGNVLNVDTSGYDTVEEMRSVLGPDGPEAQLLDNLVAHRRFLDRQMEKSTRRSSEMQDLDNEVLGPGRATPDLLMPNFVFTNPEKAIETIAKRLNDAYGASERGTFDVTRPEGPPVTRLVGDIPEVDPDAQGFSAEGLERTTEAESFTVEGPEDAYLEDAAVILRDAQAELKGGAISPETLANLSAIGAFSDARQNATGKNFPVKMVAREMASQIGDGHYLGIFQSLAYMRGLGEHQSEFLGAVASSKEGAMASALGRLSQIDTTGWSAEQIESEYAQFVTEYEDLQAAIRFADAGKKEDKRVGDYLTNKQFAKGVADRVGSPFKALSREADSALRHLTLPSQIDNLGVAGATVFDKVAQYGYEFFVDDSDTLQVIRDVPDSQGLRATPAYLNIKPKDIEKGMWDRTRLSFRLGDVLMAEAGKDDTASFSKALPEYLLAKRAGSLKDSQGRAVTDPDELGRMLDEARKAGQLVTEVSYENNGVALRLKYTPARVDESGTPRLAQDFYIQLPRFHWDRAIGPNWRKRLGYENDGVVRYVANPNTGELTKEPPAASWESRVYNFFYGD